MSVTDSLLRWNEDAYLNGVEVERGLLFELVLKVSNLGARLNKFFSHSEHVSGALLCCCSASVARSRSLSFAHLLRIGKLLNMSRVSPFQVL